MHKVILFANTDWFLYNFRLQTALGLKQAGYDVLLVSPPGEYVSRLKAAGFRWKGFEITRRGMNPIKEFISLLSLARLYRAEHPNFVIHYTIKSVIYGSFAAKLAGVPNVVNTITGLGYVFTRGKRLDILRTFVKLLYQFALHSTKVVFINHEDMNLFVQEKLVTKKEAVVIESCGVDTGKFSPPSTPIMNKKGSIVLFSGRLLKDKGIVEFAEMAKLVRKDHPNSRFVIVGRLDSGNPSALDCQILQQWQRDHLIEYWGWQDDMVTIYHKVDIVCLPSYQEGIPKSLLEAAACEKPIVATDVPGCRDVVHHQVNGILVPPRDAQALADAVKFLLDSPEMQEEMGKKGRQMVIARFSDQQVVQATLQLLHEIAATDKTR